MELGYSIIDLIQTYMSNTDIYFPIALSLVILSISISITFFLRDEALRIVLIFLLAGFFYWASIGGSVFEQEYFLNMSTELLGTIVALIIFASALTSSGWTFPVVAMIIVTLISVLTIRTDDFSNGFSLNMSTELLGAFLTTVLLKRDWLWKKGLTDSETLGLLQPFSNWIGQQMQKQHTFTIKNDSKADYYLLVTGESEVDVADKVEWLTRSGVLVVHKKDMTHDEGNNRVYQEIGLAVDTYEKQSDAITLSNQTARVRILAYQDAAYRIYKQITEVMECDEPQHVSTPHKELAHLEFTATRPRVMFSDYVETQINLLAREWRNNPDECLTAAAEHLMDWAVTMNFVKGKMND